MLTTFAVWSDVGAVEVHPYAKQKFELFLIHLGFMSNQSHPKTMKANSSTRVIWFSHRNLRAEGNADSQVWKMSDSDFQSVLLGGTRMDSDAMTVLKHFLFL